MMFRWNCRRARRQVLDLVGGEQVEEAFLAFHLAGCPPCRAYRREQERMQEILPAWQAPAPSPGFVEKTLQAYLAGADREAEPAAPPVRTWSPVGVAAAVAAVALFAVGTVSLLPERDRRPVSGAAPQEPDAFGVGRAEMVDDDRDLLLLGVALPARSGPAGFDRKRR